MYQDIQTQTQHHKQSTVSVTFLGIIIKFIIKENNKIQTPVRNKLRKSLAPIQIPASPFLKRLGYGTGMINFKFFISTSIDRPFN